jgi:Na+-translocating ferredoxin:NAD+ oxidoreductase RnfC subunit
MYNLGRLVRYGEPVIEKWVTVGGNVASPAVVKVPIGIKVSELFRALGITVPEGHTVLDGGPSMGKVINPGTATVNKTTKGLLILPDSTRAVESKLINEKMAVARAETACCQCTRCTDMCPRHLLGYPLEPHKMVRTAMGAAKVMPKMVINATLCCGCGICENIACSQGISPRAVINNYKALLKENKIRYLSEEEHAPAPEREYRRIPSLKWAQALGVAKFDKVADFREDIKDFRYAEISLSGHIGLPSIPTVSDGDFVKRGDMIARGGDGLSVAQHAPFDGVCRLLGGKIAITKA